MADIWRGKMSDGEGSTPGDKSSRAARRRRMEIMRFKHFAATVPTPGAAAAGRGRKRARCMARDCHNAFVNCCADNDNDDNSKSQKSAADEITASLLAAAVTGASGMNPKFGFASVCGRRRDMEDALAIIPSFSSDDGEDPRAPNYYGVYDGHGCSHVATKCRERLHVLVKEEVRGREMVPPADAEWKVAMERSFERMDREVSVVCGTGPPRGTRPTCRCELQLPECEAVGSTAIIAVVTSEKIIVANCGDSRAVLCRNGMPVPLSVDHKPDRPDELNRIEEAGGRVIYWDGARVLGVLAMSRAIGDNYLKPFVTCEPEVTITDRATDDECLILASDGLWDVVSNETACRVARMCLRGKALARARAKAKAKAKAHAQGEASTSTSRTGPRSTSRNESEALGEASDKVCADASMLLTKLAIARQSSDNVSVIVVDLKRDA